jgi:hypothetical protein
MAKQARAKTPFHFALVILEMGSGKQFSRVGFKPLLSRSQPPKLLVVQG